MAIDYSKWDKIEVSDDSDIEVHPNVDKKSMIRWRQQAIHEKREQRERDIKTLETQKDMYLELNKRVDQLLSEIDDSKLGDYDYISTYLAEHFDPASKPENMEEDGPTHNEMIEDLITQLKKDLEKEGRDPESGSNIRTMILGHRVKIDSVLKQNLEKLKSLYKERELHISSDDMHTGWDRSFMNKNSSDTSSATKSSTTPAASTSTSTPSYTAPSTSAITSDSSAATTQTQETKSSSTPVESTSNENSLTTSNTSREDEKEVPEIDDLWPETQRYSQLPINNIDRIKNYLKSNTHIINPQQKDSLLMKAFDAQFALEEKRTYQIIYLSVILQYVYDLVNVRKTNNPIEIGQIAEQLLNKMFENTTNKAYEAFKNEVEKTFTHIKTRCKILSEEQVEEYGEEAQEIQLKSIDEDTKLVVNLPDSKSTDPEEIQRCEIFDKLPKSMKDALKTESLDEVNKVFHGMPISQAEEILEIFDACGVIGVQAVIENENDWKHIKDEYNKQNHSGLEEVNEESEPKLEELEINEPFESSADIVD